MTRYASRQSRAPVISLIGRVCRARAELFEACVANIDRRLYRTYPRRKGTAIMWVDRSLFDASLAMSTRSCPYSIAGAAIATRIFIPNAVLP